MNDEFYVGYLERAPARLGRFLRGLVIALVLGGGFIAGWLAASQLPYARAVYEFGQPRQITGIVLERPVPAVLVERPGAAGRLPGFSRYLLSAAGKFGAQEQVRGLHGQLANLTGELIYRDGWTMLKLSGDGVAPADNSAHAARASAWAAQAGQAVRQGGGPVTLSGEIVDSQCYLGIMKPGAGKPHRACAVRCLSGGLPAVFHARDAEGRSNYYLLQGPDGASINPDLLPWVADRLRLSGEIWLYPDLQALRVDPASLALAAP